MGFLTSEAGLSLLTLAVGWFFRNKTENDKREADRQMRVIEALDKRDESMNKAAERTKDGGTWMRRALYFLVAFIFVVVMVAPFLGQSVALEIEVSKGILFWKKTATEILMVDGVFFPPEVRKAFLMFMAFYLGQGVK